MLISDFICIFWATLNHPTMRMLLHCVHRIHCVWHRSLRGNTACAHPMRSIIATCLLFRYWIPWPNNGLHLSLAMQCCPKHAVHAMSHGAAGRFCTRCTSLPHGPQQGCASEEFQQQYSDMLRVMDKLQVACPSQCKAGSSMWRRSIPKTTFRIPGCQGSIATTVLTWGALLRVPCHGTALGVTTTSPASNCPCIGLSVFGDVAVQRSELITTPLKRIACVAHRYDAVTKSRTSVGGTTL